MTLLPDCSVAGDYGYLGVSTKSQKVTLSSSDDIGANLGVGGTLPVELATALERGSALHLGYVLVGKRSSARPFVARQELEGRCDGATHFVRRADVGAFAFKSGATSAFRTALSVFSQGVEAGSTSEKRVDSTDGDPAACEAADPEATEPPSKCRAVVRVTLLPIDDAPLADVAKVRAKGADQPVADVACPAGRVLSEGLCRSKDALRGAYLCDPGDQEQCRAQCEAGSDESCGFYLKHVLADEAQADARIAAAQPLHDAFMRACEQGDEPLACGVAGWQLPPGDPGALPLQIKACRGGFIHACQEIHDILVGTEENAPPEKVAEYHTILDAACRGGSGSACALQADHYLRGKELPQDAGKGLERATRACHGGHWAGCLMVGLAALDRATCEGMKDFPEQTLYCDIEPDDAAKAREYLERACDLDGTDRGCDHHRRLAGG